MDWDNSAVRMRQSDHGEVKKTKNAEMPTTRIVYCTNNKLTEFIKFTKINTQIIFEIVSSKAQCFCIYRMHGGEANEDEENEIRWNE